MSRRLTAGSQFIEFTLFESNRGLRTIATCKYLTLILNLKVKQELLDEYTGNKLPVYAGQPYEVEQEKTDSLRENDVLLVRSFYKSSPHVKLQSIFSAFDGTRFIARTYKFPVNKLNIKVSERKRYLYRQGEFRITANSRSGIKAWIKLKQLKTDRPLPKRITNKTIERMMKQRLREGG